MHRVSLAFVAALVIGMPSVAAAGDEPERPEGVVGGLSFADEVVVTVVNVDVVVRDASGEPVEGLREDDFQIYQDGVEMPISHFAVLDQEVISHTLARTEEPAGPEPTPEPREAASGLEIRPMWMVVYIDNENIRPLERNRVLRNVRQFVLDTLTEPVRMMVVSYQRSLKVLQPFTDETGEVTDALREVLRYTGGRVERDNDRLDILNDIQERTEDPRYSGGGGSGAAQSALEGRIMAYAQEEATNLTFTLGALRQVFAMLSGLEGRKAIVYVSSGLPMTPGLGLMHEYAMSFRDSAILSRRSQVDRTRDFQSLAATANGQEVTLYTIDASGLNPLEGFGADTRYSRDPTASSIGMKNFQDSLSYLADATGGIAVINTNDPTEGLQKIRQDVFSYYSLGYTISATGQDRVHRIRVELPEHPKYELRYRRRFVERSLETRVQDRVFTSLMVDFEDNPMGLRIASGDPSPASGDRWTVPLEVTFPLSSIALVPEGPEYVGRIELFLGARDTEGRNSELQRQEHEVRVPVADYERARNERFALGVTLLLQDGQQRVAVGLMDRVTRQASYERVVITIP